MRQIRSVINVLNYKRSVLKIFEAVYTLQGSSWRLGHLGHLILNFF